MQLEGISSKSVPGQVQQKDNQTLGKDDFLKLLVTQLKYQDPLNPMEDRDFIAQTAQFSSLEQMQNLNTNLEVGLKNLLNLQYEMLLNFNSWQATLSGLNLVGKEVIGIDAEGNIVTGIVERVKFTEQGPFALVEGKEIALGDITEIGNPTTSSIETDNIEGEENE